MKMDATEGLARDICWSEFSPRGRRESRDTKITYWEKVSELKKAEYRRDARFLQNIIPKLPKRQVEALVWPVVARGH